METINSMASTAAKAIWGENNNNNDTTTTAASTTTPTTNESVKPGTETMNNETKGTEPVSGKLGDTAAGEPFDAGNLESGATNTTTSTTGTKQTEDLGASSGLPTTTSTDTTQIGSKDTTSGLSSGATDSTNTGSKGPTTEHPSTIGDTGFKAPQADIRSPDSATADPKTEAERKNVDDSAGLDKSENPTKLEGAGPKPIDEVAREHGGDAGSASKGSSGAAGAEDEDGPGAASKGEGTGEQYVKSSGLAADGGDFDATKPGAGREADRLLEEKGITTQSAAAAEAGKKTEESKAEEKTAPESPDSKKEKASLKDKIKAKLHKN
ncbi:hypothetical protein Daus18300_003601 [Diaporthe australafricana]|uniref:Glycine-rich cell wall structural protein 1 n=1 Tax=Diaporthe australafricana TaxID=127596 RepID=A0ABR3XEU7_9PEZI